MAELVLKLCHSSQSRRLPNLGGSWKKIGGGDAARYATIFVSSEVANIITQGESWVEKPFSFVRREAPGAPKFLIF